MKKPIQKINLVADWLRQVVAEEGLLAPKQPGTVTDFSLVKPEAIKGAKGLKPSTLVLKLDAVKDPERARIILAWDGNEEGGKVMDKQYSSLADAEATFNKLKEKLAAIAVDVTANPEQAQTRLTELLSEKEFQSDPSSQSHPGTASERSSTLHSEIAKGWNIINKEGKLLVDFSKEFLSEAFKNYKAAESSPIREGEFVYSTASRQHCGSDNFVISYWRKVATRDGNILRNAALISRIGGESYFLTNVPVEKYNAMCDALTPDPIQYGIEYDSVTGQCYKTAKSAIIQFFADTKEELDKILEHLGKGKVPKSEDIEGEGPKEEDLEEGAGEEKEGGETLPVGDVKETTPLGGEEGESGKSPLEELLKPE